MALYVVTGGAGFIGSHLIDALLGAGHRVRVIDDLSNGLRDRVNPAADLTVDDVTQPGAIAALAAGAAGIFHLAAIASVVKCNDDWAGAHKVNLTGTIEAFDAGRRHRIPVVYVSSAAVYGQSGRRPLPERARTAPISAYGADKLGGELHARAGGIVHGVASAGFRLFNVYGPRQRADNPYSGVISIFAGRLERNESCTIHGDGKQVRDFIYVRDVVAALIKGIDLAAPAAPVFNVGSQVPTRIVDLFGRMKTLWNSTSTVVRAPARAGDIRVSLSDCAALRATGWAASTPLDEGLAALRDSLAAQTNNI
jgi:UDP-glucose 4-epimerase